jgi:hypothetical protein
MVGISPGVILQQRLKKWVDKCAVEQHVVNVESQHGQVVVNTSRLPLKEYQREIDARAMQMILKSQASSAKSLERNNF